MPKKGSRLITSTVFRRRVSHKPTYRRGNSWSPLSSAVERAKEPGAVLVWDDSAQWGSAFTLTVAEDELAALLGEPPLDQGFYRSRWERATPAQRDYLWATGP
jgi:hypothetical protein